MRFTQYLAAAVIMIATPVSAKDVTITLDDREQQALVQVLDSATRTGGLAATQGTLYFYNKLQTAINGADAPAKAADPAAQKPTPTKPEQ